MSPTILRIQGYRSYFFSREEPRPHVHVQRAGREAKLWLQPNVALAENHGLSRPQVTKVLRLAREHRREIEAAWKAYFRNRGPEPH